MDKKRQEYDGLLAPFVDELSSFVQIPNDLFIKNIREREMLDETILYYIQCNVFEEISMHTHHLSYYLKACAVQNRKLPCRALLGVTKKFNKKKENAAFEGANTLLRLASNPKASNPKKCENAQ